MKKESLLDEYENHSCGRFQPLEEVLCEDPGPHRICKQVDRAKYREFYLKMRHIFILKLFKGLFMNYVVQIRKEVNFSWTYSSKTCIPTRGFARMGNPIKLKYI